MEDRGVTKGASQNIYGQFRKVVNLAQKNKVMQILLKVLFIDKQHTKACGIKEFLKKYQFSFKWEYFEIES